MLLELLILIEIFTIKSKKHELQFLKITHKCNF
jgi:hypothetical protein